MKKIALIDDDPIFIQHFTDLLNTYLPKYFDDYIINDIYNNYQQELKNTYDILFIDIDLHHTSGIDIIHELKNNHYPSLFIFVSSKNEMVFDALTVQPFQFIRKDNLQEDLLLTLALINNYYKEHDKLITLSLHGRQTALHVNEIIYLQSDIHEITIVTINDSYCYQTTLKNILSMLPNYFIQIQKSLIINLDYIKEINNNDIILKNGNIFSVNRHYKKDFFYKYKEYLL
ncbi:MAG: LytTR family DNA-binding domain-containing protein [Erysipelotrichaceae bacterium]|nr:LytTR family DNA-binding domain-containing protein [Erysipelotrichaceae bacterium]